MSDYFIQVEFSTPEAVRFQGRPAFRFTATIVDVINVPLEVFLCKKTLVDPDTNRQANDFVAVCGPYDLAYYPASEPEDGLDPPFFRLSAIDIMTPGVGVADEAIQAIKDQLSGLCRLLQKLDRLNVIETCWLPSTPDVDMTTTTTTTTPP